ncbi:glutaredoxin family protein [Virgibacillus sp. MSJ-26]|uniref:glutaredoxin family protein n=1 Tax=Virgibacillus sp. MSJ-26 TaxID=2841522 RepID=UPI001C10D96B|nr:glutaredoxin family protein [Virgibacillus sp. MSJ-26]MBU5467078.1 glutaredoxin family protein [Virgibacillus sp. MSJ-26]
MEDKLELELYTRPTCSDCQDAKKYLTSNRIHFADKDVSKDLSLEKEMKKISGNRIVPMFAFYKKGLFGKRKLIKHFIGFENNRNDILTMLKK